MILVEIAIRPFEKALVTTAQKIRKQQEVGNPPNSERSVKLAKVKPHPETTKQAFGNITMMLKVYHTITAAQHPKQPFLSSIDVRESA